MNEHCAWYYQIDSYRDLHAWNAERLRQAKWRQHEQAIYLDNVYNDLMQHVLRLPYKGKNHAEMIGDIHKAVSELQMLLDVLAPQYAPEHVTPPAAVAQDSPDTPTGPGSRCASCGTPMPFGGDVRPQRHVCGWTRPRQASTAPHSEGT